MSTVACWPRASSTSGRVRAGYSVQIRWNSLWVAPHGRVKRGAICPEPVLRLAAFVGIRKQGDPPHSPTTLLIANPMTDRNIFDLFYGAREGDYDMYVRAYEVRKC